MELIFMYLITALFFGAIPLSFTIIGAFLVLRRHRTLIPVLVALTLYQALSIIVLCAYPVPAMSTFWALAIVSPAFLALAGTIWTVATTKALPERVYGIGLSTIGCALTGCQVAFYIVAIWGTI
jgi:hypothetical protein